MNSVYQGGVQLEVKNGKDQNLLISDTESSFDLNDFKVYHKINDEWVKFFKSHLDSPHGYTWIYDRDEEGNKLNPYPISVGVALESDIDWNGPLYKETKIHWAEGEEDFIRTEFENCSPSCRRIKKLWINGELVYEEANKLPLSTFTLIK